MFRVELHQMTNSCQEFRPIIREIHNNLYELDGVIKTLGSMTQMERVLMELRTDRRDLESEEILITQMMEALDTTIRMYDGTEKKIVDNVEGSVVRAKKTGVSAISVATVDPAITGNIQAKKVDI